MLRIVNNQRGFTLIELVIIIILIGLLAGVAIPRFIDLRQKALVASAKGNVDAMRGALTIDFANKTLNQGTYTSPVTCAAPPCLVASGSAELTAFHNLLENVPNYPPRGRYNDPAGEGFRWYIMNVVSTTGSTPPSIKGAIDAVQVGGGFTCAAADSITATANQECDVDKL